MPAIILFGRGWNFSSDDFVFSSLYVIFLRIIGVLTVLISLPLLCSDNSLCLPSVVLILTFSGLAVSLIQILIRCCLSLASGVGGIADVSRRVCVPKLFYVHLFFILVELPLYSAIIYFTETLSTCESQSCFLLEIVCSIGIILLVGNVFAFLLTYDYAGSSWKNTSGLWCMEFDGKSKQLDAAKAHYLNASLWNRRLRCLSCIRNICDHEDRKTRKHHRDTMLLVSDIVGHHFTTNMVASDLVAGLILLRWQTHQWVGCGRKVPLSSILRDTVPDSLVKSSLADSSPKQGKKGKSSRKASPVRPLEESSSEWLSVSRLLRFMQFSAAVYGRYLYLYSQGRTLRGLCALCKHTSFSRSCCCSSSPAGALNESDVNETSINIGCCICTHDNCNFSAFYEVTKVPLCNLIHFSFINKLYLSPFLVAIDDESESIVIAIRGTMSPEDMIVDMLAAGGRIREEDMPMNTDRDFIAHMGILRTAYELRDTLMGLQLIEKARFRRPAYPLVICGHSLGAGVATILAYLLRTKYPEVKAYAYSPPLGLMNSPFAQHCNPFVCSVVYGYDMIARLSIPTLNDFKWRLLDALTNCHVPKFKLLSRATQLLSARYLLPCGTSSQIGMDTKLFNESFQQRLLNPMIPLSRISAMTYDSEFIDGILPFSHESSESVKAPYFTSNSNNLHESLIPPPIDGRCCDGPRSLFHWLRESGPINLRHSENVTKFGTFLTTASGHVHTRDEKLSEATSSQSSDVHRRFDDNFCSMDEDAQFAGSVLHVVEVNDDTDYFQNSNSQHCFQSCRKKNSHPPVGIWSSPRQFQSLLIHPRMVLDHFPDQVIGALERLNAACKASLPVTFIPNNEHHESFQYIRQLQKSLF